MKLMAAEAMLSYSLSSCLIGDMQDSNLALQSAKLINRQKIYDPHVSRLPRLSEQKVVQLF